MIRVDPANSRDIKRRHDRIAGQMGAEGLITRGRHHCIVSCHSGETVWVNSPSKDLDLHPIGQDEGPISDRVEGGLIM
jgi:hypothetical protein